MLLLHILIVLTTFFFMEFIAWFTHKYVMHGPMWDFHRDHHQPHSGFFEKNDVFFLIFAVPSWLCIMLGLMYSQYLIVSLGAGIAIYGVCYFLVHDVFIHRRVDWFRNTNNAYFMALRKAHKVHHKRLDKEKGKCFGMLIVPWKYYREARKSLKARRAKITS